MEKNKAKYWLWGFCVLLFVLIASLILILPYANGNLAIMPAKMEQQAALAQSELPDPDDPDIIEVRDLDGAYVNLDENGRALIRWVYYESPEQYYIGANAFNFGVPVMIELYDEWGSLLGNAESNLLFRPDAWVTYYIRLESIPFETCDLTFLIAIDKPVTQTFTEPYHRFFQFVAPARGYYEITYTSNYGIDPDPNTGLNAEAVASFGQFRTENSIIIGLEEGAACHISMPSYSMAINLICTLKAENGGQLELRAGEPLSVLVNKDSYMLEEYRYLYYLESQDPIQFAVSSHLAMDDFMWRLQDVWPAGIVVLDHADHQIITLLSDTDQVAIMHFGIEFAGNLNQLEGPEEFIFVRPPDFFMYEIPDFFMPKLCYADMSIMWDICFYVDGSFPFPGQEFFKYLPEYYHIAPSIDFMGKNAYFYQFPIIQLDNKVFWHVDFWNYDELTVQMYYDVDFVSANTILFNDNLAGRLIMSDDPDAVLTAKYWSFEESREIEVSGTGYLEVPDYAFMCFIESDRKVLFNSLIPYRSDEIFQGTSAIVARAIYLDVGEHRFGVSLLAGAYAGEFVLFDINGNLVAGSNWSFSQGTVSPGIVIVRPGYYVFHITRAYNSTRYSIQNSCGYISFNNSIRTRTLELEIGKEYQFSFIPFSANGNYEITVSGRGELRLYDSQEKIGSDEYLVRAVGTKLATGTIPRGQYYFAYIPYSSGAKTIAVSAASSQNQIQSGVPVNVTANESGDYTFRVQQSGIYSIYFENVSLNSARLLRGNSLLASLEYVDFLGQNTITSHIMANIEYTLRIVAAETGALAVSWEKQTELPESYFAYCAAGTTELYLLNNSIGYDQLILYVSDYMAINIRAFDSKGNQLFIDTFSDMFIIDLSDNGIFYIEITASSNTFLDFWCELY